MPRYQVHLTKTITYVTTVDATDRDEAERIFPLPPSPVLIHPAYRHFSEQDYRVTKITKVED